MVRKEKLYGVVLNNICKCAYLFLLFFLQISNVEAVLDKIGIVSARIGTGYNTQSGVIAASCVTGGVVGLSNRSNIENNTFREFYNLHEVKNQLHMIDEANNYISFDHDTEIANFTLSLAISSNKCN